MSWQRLREEPNIAPRRNEAGSHAKGSGGGVRGGARSSRPAILGVLAAAFFFLFFLFRRWFSVDILLQGRSLP